MQSDILFRSFLNPHSQTVEPFDFVVNHHFVTRASFRQFDFFENGYIVGFMIGILCTLVNSEPQDYGKRGSYQVDDIFFGMLDSNAGFKSLTITKDETNGKKLVLIHNFFFKRKLSDVHNRGLTERERKKINSKLLNDDYDQKIVEYLVFDLNTNKSSGEKCDLRVPFVERITDAGESNETAGDQVENFKSLRGLLKIPFDLLRKIPNFERKQKNIKNFKNIVARILFMKIATKIIKKIPTNSNIDQGITHGVFLATQPIHKMNIKIDASGNVNPTVYLTFEPPITIGDAFKFNTLISFDLAKEGGKMTKPRKDVIDVILNYANKNMDEKLTENMSRFITEQVHSITAFKAKHSGDNSNYINTYLLGMILAKTKAYNVYRPKTGLNSQIVLQVVGKFLIIFNFDRNVHVDFDGLKLNQFEKEIKSRGVFVISIFEKEIVCNKDLMNKDVVHEFDVVILDSKSFKKSVNGIDHYYLSPTISFMRSLLNFNNLNKIEQHAGFTEFTRCMLEIGHLAKHNQFAFGYFIEGLFHDTSHFEKESIYNKIDKFHSEAAFSVYSQSSGKPAMQINFMPTKVAPLYTEHINGMLATLGKYSLGCSTVSFFYGLDETTGNYSFHMLESVKDGFTYSVCFISNKTEVQCPETAHNHRSAVVGSSMIPTWHRTYTKIVEELKVNSGQTHMTGVRAKRDNARRLFTRRKVIKVYGPVVDNLQNPYYSTSELIWMSMLDHDIGMIYYQIFENFIGWKISLVQSVGFKATSQFALPIASVVLAIHDIRSAVESYRSGDHSALAVFNIVSSSVSLATSLMSLAINVISVAVASSTFLSAFSTAIFVVGTLFYYAGHVWKAYIHIEGINEKIGLTGWEKAVEYMGSISGRGINPKLVKWSNDFDWNVRRLQDGIEQMEEDSEIRNFISSAGCYNEQNRRKYAECDDIKIYMREKSELDTQYVAKSDPVIPAKYTQKYEKLCHVTSAPIHRFGNLDLVGDIRAIKEHLGYVKERTGYKPGNTPLTKDLEETDGTDYMSTFFCTDAFGISRQNANRSPEDITQYWLHGNSTVYASSDTINVFQLSGGEKCTIFGGQKANTFVLASEFKQGVIEGSELEMDVLILAFTLRGTQPRFILGKGDVVSAKRIKTTVSEVIIKYIDKIIIGSEVEYDDVHIFCDLKTVVVTGNKKIPTKILLTGEDCRYDLTLMLREYVNVTSIAKYGKINYKFDSLTGNVTMSLLNSKNVTHRLEMHFMNFTEIANLAIVPLSDSKPNDDVIVEFYYNNYVVSIHMKEGADSLELSFRDGMTIKYGNGSFYMNQFFPKSKARVWYDYNQIIKLCEKLGITFWAYSERDQEIFTLTSETISINQSKMKFSVFHIGSEDQQSVKIKCNSGYNAVLVSPTNLTATITEDESEWFKLVNVEVEQDTEALTVDLTLVTDTFDQLNELYYLHIDSSVNNSSILLDVHVTIQNDEKTTSYKIGSIDLHGIMIDDKYKKVKVSAKSDFIFEADDNYKTWRLIPSPRVISPFSPIVVLDPFVVEKNQTILFDSRVMNNYDVVELDDSTLLITNMASDMIKSLILTAQSVPLLTIIIEDYKSERMRDVRLKFEQDVEIDLINLDGRRIISYDVFQMKINLMSERINEEGLILRHDRRFQRSKTQSIYCSPWVIMPQWKSTDNSLPFVMNDMTCTK